MEGGDIGPIDLSQRGESAPARIAAVCGPLSVAGLDRWGGGQRNS
jgi:hypothetical protein